MKPHLLLIVLPLVVRHAHHFWCTRHAGRGRQKRGMVSVAVWFTSYIILMAGVFVHVYRADSFHWNFWTGVSLLWCACAGRMVSIHQLGKAFSEFIHVGPGQRLVDTGIYAYIRHPLHYFLLLEMVAMAVIAGSFWGWGLVGLSIIILVFRELDEEKALEQAFGEEYREYRKRAVAVVDAIPTQRNRRK